MGFVRIAAILVATCAAGLAGASLDAKFIGAGAANGAKPACVRRVVANEKLVTNATWRVTGLGVFTAYVNGRAIGDSALMPGYTHPKKRRMEAMLDVTKRWNCAAGATNELSAIVTSGWWCDGIMGKNGGKWPAFRGVLTLAYMDGTTGDVVSDESWLVSTETPVVSAGIWEGEVYDARIAPTNWIPALVSSEFKGEVSPWIGPLVQYREDLAMGLGGVGSFSLQPGEKKIIDFGQNCAAIPYLTVKADAGTRVTVRFAEMLNDGIRGHHGDGPAGSLYTANMRGAKSAVEYICRGGGKEEMFCPWHTFYGYRYAEVSADGPAEGNVRSLPVTSVSKEMERGMVETGDERVNRLVKNAYWGMLSNYISIPTDCPQRTERLGWTGDTQVFSKTASYFADVRGFFRKWMQDVRDTQHADGTVPHVVPLGAFGDGGPIAGWSDAAIIVPWTMWKYLGDKSAVRENWDAMERYMSRIAKDGYTTKRGKWLLCDWLSFENLSVDQSKRWSNGSYTDDHLFYQNFLNACHLLQDARMMKEMKEGIFAQRRGGAEMNYKTLSEQTKARILKTWFKEDGALCDLFKGMQTPALFALKLGLGDRRQIAAGLVASIRANGDRLSTGFLGTPLLCEVLSDIGETELAYTILLQRKFPSWLYTVDQGATTMWERWNSYTKESGFGDVRMNSFNHYAYGAVVGWLFEHAAGIRPDPDAPGWAHFILAPEPDARLGRLKATYKTDFGTIESAWEYGDDGVCRWRYTVPAGTAATVRLPDGKTFEAHPGTSSIEFACH